MGAQRDNLELIKVNIISENKYHCKNIGKGVYTKARSSILKSGQLKTIVVREVFYGHYEIIKGNRTFSILKEEGYESVYCFNVGDVDDNEAKLIYLQLSNELEVNYVKISQIINDIFASFPLIDIERVVPYTKNELIELKKVLDFNWEKYKKVKHDVNQQKLF